jgi:hypothetical protein
MEKFPNQSSSEANFARELETNLAKFVVNTTAPIFFDLAMANGFFHQIENTQMILPQLKQALEKIMDRRIKGKITKQLAIVHQIEPWAMKRFLILLNDHQDHLAQLPLFSAFDLDMNEYFTSLEWPEDFEIQHTPENAQYAYVWLLKHLKPKFRMIVDDFEARGLLQYSYVFDLADNWRRDLEPA